MVTVAVHQRLRQHVDQSRGAPGGKLSAAPREPGTGAAESLTARQFEQRRRLVYQKLNPDSPRALSVFRISIAATTRVFDATVPLLRRYSYTYRIKRVQLSPETQYTG